MKKLGWVERRDKMEKVFPELLETLRTAKATLNLVFGHHCYTEGQNNQIGDALKNAVTAIGHADGIVYKKPDPETELRASWTKQGVPKERQDEIIREVEEKAKPGAKVGPFTIGE